MYVLVIIIHTVIHSATPTMSAQIKHDVTMHDFGTRQACDDAADFVIEMARSAGTTGDAQCMSKN